MKIHYSSKKLEKILTDPRLIKKEYSDYYKKIISRLSELSVAESLFDIPEVPPPRRHKLKGEYKNCWGIDYYTHFRIIIRPTGEYDINDLKSITEIIIIDLEDYH